MKARKLCNEFKRKVLEAVGHTLNDSDLTAAQLTKIDDWWMQFFFEQRGKATLRELLAAKSQDGKAKGASA
jgi:hypothetical protein